MEWEYSFFSNSGFSNGNSLGSDIVCYVLQ